MILRILKSYWILYYKIIFFQICVNSLHSSASSDAIHLRLNRKFHTRVCTCAGSINENQAKTLAFVSVAMFLFQYFLCPLTTTTEKTIHKHLMGWAWCKKGPLKLLILVKRGWITTNILVKIELICFSKEMTSNFHHKRGHWFFFKVWRGSPEYCLNIF